MADPNPPTTADIPPAPEREEYAQARRVAPVEVPRPGAGQVVTIAVEKGRPIKLAFAVADIQSRQIEGDDLVLTLADGGKVALKGYVSAFGAADARFVVVQADGKSFAASELLSPGAPAGRRPPPKTPAAGDEDYVIVNKPKPDEIVVVKLDPKKQPALNFGIRDVAGSSMDGDTLVVRFKDGGTIRFENYKQYAENPGTKFSFGKSAEIPSTSVPKVFEASPGGRPDRAGPGGPGSHPFDTPFDPGKLGPGLDHLNGLPGVDFLDPPLGGPDGPLAGPPGGPPGGGGGGGGGGGNPTPQWFLNGPAAVNEAANANNVLGINFLNLQPGQTRSIDLKLAGVGIGGKPAVLPADINPGAAAFVAKLQAEIAAAVATVVPPGSIVATNLADGVRLTFAPNAPLQLPFKLAALADLLIEGGETYRLTISDPLSQGGATPAAIQAGKEKVETEILDQTKGNWELTGDALVVEGAPNAPKYTLTLANADLVNGQTASVVVKGVFAAGAGNATPSNDAGSNADRDFSEAFFKDLQDALAATPGVTLQNLGNNMVRITLSDTAAQTLMFTLPTFDDPTLEPDEKFRVEIADPSANTQLSANPALRAVETTILDNETVVWRIDGPATVNEGDAAAGKYTVSYAGNPVGPVSIKLDVDLPGGIGGAEAADFAQQLNQAVALAIDPDGPGGNPPLAGVTYDPATQTLTLAPTVKNFMFTLPTLDDAKVERPEAYAVKIQNPSEGRVEQDKAVTVILDNDAPPVPEPRTFELTGDKEVSEGNAAKYWIELKGPLLTGAETATVTLRIDTTGLPQPATLPGNPNPDFAQTLLQAIANQLAGTPGIGFATVDPSGAQITISYGAATPRQLMFTMPTLDDVVVEGDERYRIFVVNTGPGTSVAPDKGEVVTAILDDDRPAGAVTWAIGGTDVVLEGGTPSYTVVRTGDPIAPGNTQTVEISVSYPGGAFGALPADFAEALLKDIQDSLVPGITAALAPNGNIRLTYDSTAPREFNFTLPTLDDATPENTEVFAVSLVNQSAGAIPLGQGIVETRILDNDFPAPNVVIGDATAFEGDPLTFQVNLSNPSGQTITLRLATTDGSANAGPDFAGGNFLVSNDGINFVPAANGTDVTFAPGQTQLFVRVAGIEDLIVEPNENFTLRVASVVAGTVGNSADTGTGTIVDDDTPQWFLAGATMVDEGADAGYTLGLTQLALQPGQTRSIDIKLDFPAVVGKLPASAGDFQIAVGTLLGELTEAVTAAGQGANISLAALPDGVRVTFNASAIAALPFNHSIAVDGLVEGGEAYRLTISNPLNSAGAVAAPIAAGSDTVTTMIVDRDMGKWELVGDAQVVEGTLGKAEYRLDLKNADLVQGQSASVVLKAVFGAGAGFATPSNAANNNPDRDFSENFLKDLQDALGGAPGVSLTDLGNNMVRVTFADTSAQNFTFSLPTLDDATAELNESYRIEIADASANSMINPALSAVTTLIVDNDRPQWLLVGDTMTTEGGQPLYALGYVGPPIQPGQPVSIVLDIELPAGLGGADAADFVESFVKDIQDAVAGQPGKTFDPATRTLTFDNTATTQLLFALPTFDDALFEGDESFTVKILNQSVGDIVPGKDAVVTTIKDNDLPPGPRQIALTGDTSVTEGMAGGYTVTLSGPPLAPGQTQSIDIKVVAPGGAGQAAPADFVEGFLKDLQDSLGATPGLVIADQGGGVVRLTYSSATPPALAFALPTLDDAIVEGNETYSVMIQNPLGGATVAAGKDMVQTVIVDNDRPGAPLWSIAGASSVVEGGQPMYTVVRTGDPIAAGQSQSLDVTIKLPGLLPGAEKADFVNAFLADMQTAALAVPGSGVALVQDLADSVTVRLTFANNPPTPVPAQFSFKLPTLDDTIYEGTEVYAVSIANPSAGTVNPGEAVVETRILDNDPLVWTIGGGGAVPEGNAAGFSVSLNRAAEGPVSIKLAPVLPGDVGGAEAADFVEGFLKDVTDAVLALGPGAGVSFDQATATLTFLPGTQLFAFTLPTAQDTKAEGNEAFAVKILNPDTGTVAADVANAVILDDDAPAGRNWALSGDNTVNEGAAAKYLLTLDGPALLPGESRFVDIKLTTAGLTDPATLPGNPNPDIVSALLADLQAAAALTTGVTVTDQGGGVLRIAFSGTNAPFAFALPTTADALVEANENFAVMLQNPQAGTALAPDKGMVTTTIVDDDRIAGAVTWQIAGTDQVPEGGVPSYTILRNGDPIPAGQQNFLDLNIALPGGANGAEAADFLEAFLKDIQDALPAGIAATAIPNGVRLAYESTAPKAFTFTLPTFDDTTHEGIEAYTVSIVNQTAGTIVPDKAAVETKIVDNDALTWKIEGVATVTEGGAPAYTVSVNRDHENPVSIKLDAVVPGGAGGADAADFVEAFAKDVQDGLVAGVTFDAATRTLTFAPGTNSYTFTLPTFDDAHPEFAEAFTVKILNPNAGAIETDKDKVLTHILDNDAPQPAARSWELSGDSDVAEADLIDYTLRLNGPPLAPGETKFVDIKLTTAGLTDPATLQNATNNQPGADLSINLLNALQVFIGGIPGVTLTDQGGGVVRITLTAAAPAVLQFALPTADDALVEPTERLAAMLQNPDAGTTIAPDKGMVTTEIGDNDGNSGPVAWSLSGDDVRVEGGNFNYVVTRTGGPIPAGQIQTIDLAIRYPGGADGALPQDFERPFLTDIQNFLPPGITAQLLPGSNTVRLAFESTAPSQFLFVLGSLNDSFAENTEAFAISIVNPTAGTIVPGAGVVESRILDTDSILWKLEGSATVTEGAAATYTVSYAGKPVEPVRIDLQALLPSGLGGAEAQDFIDAFEKDLADAVAALPPNSGIARVGTTLVFQPSANSFTFTLPTLDDSKPEGAEAFTIKIQNPTEGRIEPVKDAVVTTILDNDGPPVPREWILSGDTSVNEGGAAAYRLDLTGGPIQPGAQHTIQLKAIPGTVNPATASGQPGGDFVEGFLKDLQDALAGTPGVTVVDIGGGVVELRFVQGAPTTVNFTLPTFDDATNEGDEDYAVMLQAPSPGTDVQAGKGMVTTFIADDDDAAGRLEWAITGTNLVVEGGVPGYTIVRGGDPIAPGQTRSVELVATYPGGANGALPADFAESFLKDIQDALPPGITAALLPGGNVLLTYDSTAPREFTFTLPTFDDAFAESTEAYAISLANQSDGEIQQGLGAVETRILDNDTGARPQWSIKGDASVVEGTPNAAQYTISLANAQPGQSYAVELGIASVTPGFGGADFVNPNLLQSIAAQLPAGATLDAGTGLLTFAPGTTSVTFALPTLDDAIVEGPESYTVSLNGGTNGSAVMAGMESVSTTIIDNDLPPGRIAWQIEGTPQVTEGGTPSYTVGYIGGPITAPVSIQIDQVFGEGFGGADIEDFVDLLDKDIQDAIALLPPGTGIAYDAATNRLTFQPGAPTSLTFGLPTTQDAFKEGTESYAIQIQDPSAGGTIVAGKDNALTTIVDDDAIVAPERLWSITGDYSRVEGQTFNYTVKLGGTALGAGETASVQIVPTFPGGPNGASLSDFAFAAFSDRVAAAVAALPPGSGVSYNPGTGTLTFSGGGLTSLDFTLPTLTDAVAEGDEVYSIGLVGAANSQILQIDNAVFSIIVDDDFPPAAVEWKLSGSVLVNEGEVPTYTVSWNGPALAPGQNATVRLNLNAPGGDFGALPADFAESFVKDIQDAVAALPPGTGISFDAGTQTLAFSSTAPRQFTFALPTFDDAFAEFTESYVVSLSNQNIGTIADTLGAVDTRIVDNDKLLWKLEGQSAVAEGGAAGYTVSYTGASAVPVSIKLDAILPGGLGGAEASDFLEAFVKDIQDALPANPGVSFDAATRTLTFAPGTTSFAFTLPTRQDFVVEGDEAYTIQILNPNDGSIAAGKDAVVTTILDDDRPPVQRTWTLSGDAAVNEGGAAKYAVDLSGGPLLTGETRTIDLKLTVAGLADPATLPVAAGQDLVNALLTDLQNAIALLPPGSGASVTDQGGGVVRLTLTGPNAPTRLDFALPTVDDLTDEANERFAVMAQAPSAGTVIVPNKDMVVTTILDDDTPGGGPAWSISGTDTVVEGGTPSYTILRDGAPIAAGQSEMVNVTITLPGGLPGAEAADFVEGFLKDVQDALPAGIAAALVPGGAPGTVTVKLTYASNAPKEFTIPVPTANDAVNEGTESYAVSLSNPTAGAILPGQGAVETRILDNDPILWKIEGSPTVVEGQSASYTVSIDRPSDRPVSIRLAPVLPGDLGGAEAADFVESFLKDVNDAVAALPPGSGVGFDILSGVLTFAPGTTQLAFTLPTLDDAKVEGNEAYDVQILNPTLGSVQVDKGVAHTVILDNDAPPPGRTLTLSGDDTVSEGNRASYTVSYQGAALAGAETVSVLLRPVFTPGLGNAEAADFQAAFVADVLDDLAAIPGLTATDNGNGTVTVTFAAGAPRDVSFTLRTAEDAVNEGDEPYRVEIFNPAGATIRPDKDAVTTKIVDDDQASDEAVWKLTGTDVVAEGGAPSYTLVRAGDPIPAGQTRAIDLAIAYPGGADGALPADFVETFLKDVQDALVPGVAASLLPGTNTLRLTLDSTAPREFTFTLPTFDDLLQEATESFTVSIQNPTDGFIRPGQGAVDTRILDNDAIPNVRIGDAQAQEGEKLVFEVTLTGPALDQITLRLGTTDGTATGGLDYETGTFEYSTDGGLTYLPAGGPNGRDVIVPAGSSGIKVRIDSIEDTIDEPNETFTLRVDSVPSGTVGNTSDTGTGTIVDDDDRPRVLIGDASANEGDPLVFDVTLSNPSAGVITIDLATTNGSATGGIDFETTQFEVSTDGGLTFAPAGGANGTQVSFQPGQTALKVRIASFEDTDVEPNETFTLRVGNLVAGDADVTDTGTGTILNDDFRPVDAKDDKDMVRIGGAPTKGNVVAGTDPDADPVNQGMQVQDDLGTNPGANVTQLKYTDAAGNPQTVAVPANGQVTVTTYVGGTLTLESDGDYTYTAPAALGSSVAIGVPAGTNSAGANLAQWQGWLAPQSGNAGDPLSKAYTVSIVPEGGAIAVKSVTVPNGGPTYTGVGIVGAAGDETEIDRFGPAEALKIDFNGVCMTSATIGLAALFDGVLFDNGTSEVARIEAVNSMTGQVVATALVNGTRNGLAEATISAPPGEVFDLIRLVPVDNAAAQQPNNSDFLLQYVRADRAQIEDSFVYTIQGTGDGSTDSANLTIKIKPPAGGKLLISDAQAQEGDKLVFDVTLSEPATGATTLRLGTADGSATGGADFETGTFEFSTDNGATWQNAGGPNGRDVTLPNGATAIKVRIDSLEDTIDEPNETFTLRVDQVVTGTVADFADTGTGTILDDDGGDLCAKDDTDMARAGGTVTTGNVVTGVDPDASPVNKMALMADDLGVNGSARVFELGYRDADGNPATVVVPANGQTTVTTVLGGKLTIESDGDYSYAPPPANVANDIFIGVPVGNTGAGADLAQWQAWLKPQSGNAGDALAKAYTVDIGTDGGQLAVKSVSVPNGPTYTGVGIARNGGDEREIDQFPWESLTLDFRGLCMTGAKLGVAALFDGTKFDNGNVEVMRWEAWDSTTSTLVATGDVRGTANGLAEAIVAAPPGKVFDHIRVYGLDNGAANAADNSDFLIQYVRAADVALVDTFTYKIEGNVDGAIDEATLSIKIKPPENGQNQPVDARDDTAETAAGRAVTIDVLGNDAIPDGKPADGVSVVTPPANGRLVEDADGRFVYTPNAGFTGDDSFTYRLTDTNGDADTATVRIRVKGEDKPGKLLINEIGLNNGTAPDGETGVSYVELRNAGDGALSKADLARLRLELKGTEGEKAVVNLATLDPPADLPGGAFLVIYENCQYRLFAKDGTVLKTGAWDGNGRDWNFGGDTSEALGANLYARGGESVDAFFANGMNTGGFRGQPKFDGRVVPGNAALAAVLGDDVAEALSNAQFNGKIASQRGVLDLLGLGASGDKCDPDLSGPKIFARVWGPADAQAADSDNVRDWTVANAPTPGKFNLSAGDINPLDPSDDFNPLQNAGITTPLAGQTVLDARLDPPSHEGGRGPDFLYGSERADTLVPGNHNDFAFGDKGDDRIRMGRGADLAVDVEGRDFVTGDSGDDVILASAKALDCPPGAPESGRDLLVGDTVVSPSQQATTPTGSDVIVGGDADDVIFGDNLVLDPATKAAFDANDPGDLLAKAVSRVVDPNDPNYSRALHEAQHALGQADRIEAGAGDDVVFGQGGDDHIAGGDGDDTIYGGAGRDVLKGGAGRDKFVGLDAGDVLRGGGGHDTLVLEGGGVFDLRGLGGSSIRGIDRVDMTGGGNAELKLDYADLVGMTDDGKLTVNGGAGDKVTADLSGHAVQVQNNGSVTIYVIDGGAATLTVDNQMQHNVIGI